MMMSQGILKYFKPATKRPEQENVARESDSDNDISDINPEPQVPETSSNDLPSSLPSCSSVSAAPSIHGKKKTKDRDSGVNMDWKTLFPWLEFTEGNQGMLCTYCSQYATKSHRNEIWITIPCTRIRKSSLNRHATSSIHKYSMQAMADAKMRERDGSGQIEKAVSSLRTLNRQAFVGALKCMYFVAYNELPHTTLYEKLLTHAKLMRCDYLKHLRNYYI